MCGCVSLCLSIHSLIDTWIVSFFGYCKLQSYEHWCTGVSEFLPSIPLGIYVKVEWNCGSSSNSMSSFLKKLWYNTSNMNLCSMNLTTRVPHVSGIMLCLSFCDPLISLSIMRFLHTVPYFNISFLFKAETFSIICMFHILFVHSFFNGYLGPYFGLHHFSPGPFHWFHNSLHVQACAHYDYRQVYK